MYMERIDRLWNTNNHTHVIVHQFTIPNLLNGMGIVEYKGLGMYVIEAINQMYVCMYVLCVFTFKNAHAHTHARTHTHTHTHTQTHTHTDESTHTYL